MEDSTNMAGYQFTSDLLEDLLFRAGELNDGSSDFQAQALRYLNRSQEALAQGGAEFTPEIQEDWWWLRKSPPGVLTLAPFYEIGTIVTTHLSAAVSFLPAPVESKQNWFLAVSDHPDVFRIIAHDAGSPDAILDSPYTGPTGTGQAFWMMKLEYDLAPDVMRLLSVNLNENNPDAPIAAQVVDQNTIRFEYSGVGDQNQPVRVEYEYLYRVPLLINAPNEEPTVPREWRRLIVDGALFFLYYDKNDNRTDGMGLLLIKGLKAMMRENHHKNAIQNSELGRIRPRQDDYWRWGTGGVDIQMLRP